LGLVEKLIVGAGAVASLFSGNTKATDFLDIWNWSFSIDRGEQVKVYENFYTGEYLRSPLSDLRIYGWGKNGPILDDHAISPISIEPNKTYLLKFCLEAETCPNGVDNAIDLNYWRTNPINPAKRNFFMRQDPNSPRKGTPEKDPNVYDLIDLTNYFTQNAQIGLPNITSSTPRTPTIYDKWQMIISNYADIEPSVTDGNLPNGKVDFRDFARLANNWGRTDCNSVNHWCAYADLNRSGTVNEYDLSSFSEQWLVDPNSIR